MDSILPSEEEFTSWLMAKGGLPHVNWEKAKQWVDQNAPCEHQEDVWNELAERWLDRLAQALPGNYQFYVSKHFTLLAYRAEDEIRAVGRFLEDARRELCRMLGELVSIDFLGRLPVIGLNSEENFVAYLDAVDEGTEETSMPAGVFVGSGYRHVVFHWRGNPGRPRRNPDESPDVSETTLILAHELVHALLSHLNMPAWLNEGLAMALMRDANKQTFFAEIREGEPELRVHELQGFWTGADFWDPEASAQAYELAETLVLRLSGNLKRFRRFVESAKRDDCGDSAAREHLGQSLQEIMNSLLGPGDWAPKLPLKKEDEPPAPTGLT